jgi:L-lactate dehydrogenase complex protein LldG
MSAREDILRSIRRYLPQSVALPELDASDWIVYDDPVRQFAQTLEGVGGECFEVQAVEQIIRLLGDEVGPEKTVVSTVPGLLSGRFDLAGVRDPHDLQNVDLAILPGALAVAENAAIWVTDAGLEHRVLYFLCQHLALVVPRDAVVHHMAQAYERIDAAERPFGCFISGPSKTADIEQSLVKGAHGARTLKVFLVQQPFAS